MSDMNFNPCNVYVSRRVEIEAIMLEQRFAWPDWFGEAVTKNIIITYGLGKFGHENCLCEISTPEGVMIARAGDYIIKGTEGEIYPCKASVFHRKYDRKN